MYLLRCFCALLLSGLLVSPAAHALSAADKDALTILLLGPKANPVKDCMNSALEHNLGVTMLFLGHASDEKIESSLLSGATTPELKQLREDEIAEWRTSRQPGRLAEMSYNACLKQAGITGELGAVGQTCFSLVGLPARAAALKRVGVERSKAISESVQSFNGKLHADFVESTVAAIYDNDDAADPYLVHRRVFLQCIRQPSP